MTYRMVRNFLVATFVIFNFKTTILLITKGDLSDGEESKFQEKVP